MCQLDRAKGCPDSWYNIISGCVCEGVPGRDVTCESVDCVEIALTNVGGPHPVHKKVKEGQIPCPWTLQFLVSGLWTRTELYHWLYRQQTGGCLSVLTMWANSCNKSNLSIHLPIYLSIYLSIYHLLSNFLLVLFLWRTLTNTNTLWLTT